MQAARSFFGTLFTFSLGDFHLVSHLRLISLLLLFLFYLQDLKHSRSLWWNLSDNTKIWIIQESNTKLGKFKGTDVRCLSLPSKIAMSVDIQLWQVLHNCVRLCFKRTATSKFKEPSPFLITVGKQIYNNRKLLQLYSHLDIQVSVCRISLVLVVI